MERLPPEITSQIFEYLEDVHRRSVLSLALANKLLYSVATRYLCRTISIRVDDAQELARAVDQYQEKLERDSAFATVRRLKISVLGRVEVPFWYFSRRQNTVKPITSGYWRRPIGNLDAARHPQEDLAWLSLASLMRRMTGLTDLYYEGFRIIRPCLLETLHEHLPRCRLHVTLGLFSLDKKDSVAHVAALARSPSLYSVCVPLDNWEHSHPRLRDIVYAMVGGLAPNLREIHQRSSTMLARYPDLPPRSWRDLPSDRDKGTRSKASLYHLAFKSSNTTLGLWQVRTDFSVLRALSIVGGVGQATLSSLESLATQSMFASLDTLRLTTLLDKRPFYYKTAVRFISNLPSLSSLTLADYPYNFGPLDQALSVKLRRLFLRHCGGRFSAPSYTVALSAEDIHRLHHRCPNLEQLEMHVRRSRGDSHEVAVYQALGRLSQLRHLTLKLCVDPPDWHLRPDSQLVLPLVYRRTPETGPAAENMDTRVEPHFTAFDTEYLEGDRRPYRKGHVRDIFINSAVDGHLARSIFHTISSTKEQGAVLLETLDIEPHIGTLFPMLTPWNGNTTFDTFGATPSWPLRQYLRCLGGPEWHVSRDPRCDRRHVVHAVKPQAMEPRREFVVENREIHEILRRLWPETRPGSDWRDDWRSWPLRRNGELMGLTAL